jgi:hypothetical protein
MKVELLRIAGCPNTDATRILLRKTLHELGLGEQISEVQVSDAAEAETLAFPGSPTIRVDGVDVEQSRARPGSYGLSCRVYLIDGRLRGLPSRSMIRDAIQSAISRVKNEKES